jgi:hypothetical protein
MSPEGKKKLIKSLAVCIGEWLEAEDPNNHLETDIGWVSKGFKEQLASLVVTALELNSASQEYMESQDLLAKSAG